MNFWLTLVGYEAVWFSAVIGAGHGLVWPGVVAMLVFAAWRLAVSAHRPLELRLIGVTCLVGIVFDGVGVVAGLMSYAAPWPWPQVPAWLTAIWAAFALTLIPLFGYLHSRLWLAAILGAIGGPLAYLGAVHGWAAASLSPPVWRPLLLLAGGWAILLPLLCELTRRGLNAEAERDLLVLRDAT